VALARYHWRRPEAWPARGRSVCQWLPQSAKFASLEAHWNAIRYHWQDSAFLFPLQPPLRRSLVRSTERKKITRKRRAQVRKSGVVAERKNTCCRRFLLVGCQYARRFERTRVRKKGNAFIQIESVPIPIKPYLLGKPLPGRRQSVKAASREAVARHAPALKGWRWSGLLGFRLGSHRISQRAE
jgi:hypothetical protein